MGNSQAKEEEEEGTPREEAITAMTREDCLAHITAENCDCLSSCPAEFLKDKTFLLAACKKNHRALTYASTELQDDADFVYEVCRKGSGKSFQFASPEMRANKDVVLKICKYEVEAFQFAANELRSSKEVVLEACRFHGGALEFAAPELQCDREVALMASAWSPNRGISFACQELRNDTEFMFECCRKSGNNLEFASPAVQADPKVVWMACQDPRASEALGYASQELRANKAFVLQMVGKKGRNLQYVAEELQSDEEVVLAAICQDGYALKYAPEVFRENKAVVLQAFHKNGLPLQFATKNLQADKEVVSAACKGHSAALKHATETLRADKTFILDLTKVSTGSFLGGILQFSSSELQADKEVVLAVCQKDGSALKHASAELQADRDLVLKICERDGNVLQAAQHFQNDKEVVLRACQQNGNVVRFASIQLKSDKDVAMVACDKNHLILKYLASNMRDNKDVVIKACQNDGRAFVHASERLRADRDVVCVAVKTHPDMLKNALGGLHQDPACLIAAGFWKEDYSKEENLRKIVLSTRFSLKPESYSEVNTFTSLLQGHGYIQSGHFSIYSPNVFNKSTCDPEWTRFEWPCRGTFETCSFADNLKTGAPQNGCCWRYSFRYQMEQAKQQNGFMIQIAEEASGRYLVHNSGVRNQKMRPVEQELGNGQTIERQMAHDMKLKVFRVHRPVRIMSEERGWEQEASFAAEHINVLISVVSHWYDGDCKDMSEVTIKFWSSPTRGHLWDVTPKIRVATTATGSRVVATTKRGVVARQGLPTAPPRAVTAPKGHRFTGKPGAAKQGPATASATRRPNQPTTKTANNKGPLVGFTAPAKLPNVTYNQLRLLEDGSVVDTKAA